MSYRLITCVFLAVVQIYSAPYTISKVAGSDPVNLPGTSIGVGRVREVATGPGGVLYFADETKLYRRTADGLVSRVRVVLPAGSEFPSITSLAIAANGDLYFSTWTTIYKMAGGSGTPQRVAGGGAAAVDGPALNARFNLLSALTVAPDAVYFIDYPLVRRVTNSGQVETVATGITSPPPGHTGVGTPAHLALDTAGNLYIFDQKHIFRRTPAGVLTIRAGGGFDAASEGIPATSAYIGSARSVAIDGTGTIYIGDVYRIRVIDPNTGAIRTIAGTADQGGLAGDGGAAASARFGYNLYLAADADGTLYVADHDNFRLRRISSGTRIVTTIAGGGPSGDGAAARFAQVYYPSGLALDGAGNLYIADTDNARVRKISAADGKIATVAGDGIPLFHTEGATTNRFDRPLALAFDAAGRLYVRDVYRIRKLEGSNWSPVAGGGSFIGPVPSSIAATDMSIVSGNYLAVAQNGDVYFDDYSRNDVFRIPAGGGQVFNVASAGFWQPSIAFDPGGSLVIAAPGNRPYRMDTATETLTLIHVPLGSVRALATDAAGNIYFAASTGNPEMTVRRIDPATNTIATIAGGGSNDEPSDGSAALEAKLYDVGGIVADSQGNLYVSDRLNYRVWRLSPALEITTPAALPAGQAGTAYSATLAAVGGVPPYNAWSVTAGSLPSGLSLNAATGQLTGTPATVGTFSFNVQVTDSVGATASRAFTLAVSEGPTQITLSPQSGTGAVQEFTATVTTGSRPTPAVVHFLVADSLTSPPNACFVEFTTATKAFRLLAPNGQSWLGPSTSGTLSNTRCTLDVTGSSSTSAAGGVLTVRFALAFDIAFAGTRNLYVLTSGMEWARLGTWTIPATPREPRVGSLQPLNGTGLTQTFTATFTHSGGASEHYLGYILLLPTPNIVWYTAANSCLVEYNRISHGMRLINEAGDNWLGPLPGVTLSQGGTLSNSRCTLNISQSSAEVNGTTMTIRASLTLNPRFTGTLGTFLQAQDVHGVWTGMTQFGNWTGTPQPAARPGPYVGDTTPASTSGTTASLRVTTGHTGGTSQLGMIHVRIASAIVGGAPCHLVYFPASDTLNLINDAETAMVSPTGVTPGSGTLTNSRCSVATTWNRTTAGNNITLDLPLTFARATFSGTKNVYVNAFDTQGSLTHWVHTATVTVQ